MINSNTELAEMISTRISHDLIGNIGALSSALELMKENNDELDEGTKGIITTAAHTLKARQTFFRIAFGLETKTIEAAELENICKDFLSTIGSRQYPLNLQLSGTTAALAKFLCLSVMIGAEVNSFFNNSKALKQSSSNTNGTSFMSKEQRGFVILEKSLINLR